MFGDKSLVDMCLRAPRRAEDMLGIYGMGERKYEKYGAAFFAVIDAYRADHPDAVLSLDPPAPEPEKPLPSEKKKKPPKAPAPRVLPDGRGRAQLQLSGQLYRRGAEGRADRDRR